MFYFSLFLGNSDVFSHQSCKSTLSWCFSISEDIFFHSITYQCFWQLATASFDSKNISTGLFFLVFDFRTSFSTTTVTFTKTALHQGHSKNLRTSFPVVTF